MFERFTDGARRVVVLAQEDARSLSHNYIGTEHFLLALLHEATGIAAQALGNLGLSYQAVRQSVEETVGRGAQPPSGHMPFSPRAKAVLESAFLESQQSRNNEIDTQHLLLGLLRVSPGVGVKILIRMGATPAGVRTGVIDLVARQDRGELLPGEGRTVRPGRDPDAAAGTLGRLRGLLGGDREGQDAAGVPAPARPATPVRRGATKTSRTLDWRDQMGVNLSERARRGRSDPLIGRRALADRLFTAVCRRDGNNALLVGETGVGKTALISGLVRTIVDGADGGPPAETEVWQVAHTALWAARVNALTEPGADAVLLVVEDLDLLLAADQPGPGFAAATLNAICHSSRPLVATISPSGYAALTATQPLLAAQFQRIDVPPADAAETVAILTGLRGLYQDHHGVTITDGAISAAPALAAVFLPNRPLPGAALDLIDTAGARLKVAGAGQTAPTPDSSGPAVVDESYLAEVAREIADDRDEPGPPPQSSPAL